MDSGRLHDDLEPWWLPDDDAADAPPPSARPRRRPGTGTELLAAAMFGLADAMGHDQPRRELTELVAEAPIGNDLPLDFGPLDPLE